VRLHADTDKRLVDRTCDLDDNLRAGQTLGGAREARHDDLNYGKRRGHGSIRRRWRA
jgi:hypothetical protein